VRKNLAIISMLCLLFAGCTPKLELEKQTFFSLGTVCSVSLPTGTKQVVFDEVKASIEKVNSKFSRTSEQSELYKLNQEHRLDTDEEFFHLIEQSLRMADLTNGAFNPAIGGLTGLWNIGTDQARVPTKNEIAKVSTDYRQVRLDPSTGNVSFPQDIQLDLGGIAKGYGADCARAVLEKNKIERGLINLGGNVYAIGCKKNGSAWRIGLRDPNGEPGESFIIIEVRDKSLVTSGAYERFFVQDGVTYHHILDSNTGYPAQSDLLSVSIIGSESTICDALSTAVFVLGSTKGLALINRTEGYDCVLMKKDGSLLFSDQFPYQYSLEK